MQAFAGSSAPTGWLLCNGTTASRTTYSNLYSVIGTTYGVGDGSTTFGLPDMRGRVPMGAGTGNQQGGTGSGVITGGTSLAARTAGQFGGDERLQDHNHQLGGILAQSVPVTSPTNYVASYSSGGAESRFTSNVNSGGLGGTPGTGGNMPPFVVLNYVIKAIPDTPRGGMTATFTPPIVTSLPLVPQFGDQVVYAADTTNGVYWLLQYDASGTYPWKFLGGPPLAASGGGYVAVTSVAPTFASISGASVTAALAGDYSVRVEGQVQNQAGYATFLSCSYGATVPTTYEGPIAYSPTAVVDAGGSREARKTLAASDAVVAKGAVNAGTGYIGYTRVLLTPIRVKAA
jgi:microcystin-dependent protein